MCGAVRKSGAVCKCKVNIGDKMFVQVFLHVGGVRDDKSVIWRVDRYKRHSVGPVGISFVYLKSSNNVAFWK